MRYTSTSGKTYDVDPQFGHALEALGWTTDGKKDTQHTGETDTGETETGETDTGQTDEDRGKWKKADWAEHATTLGIDVDGLTVDELKDAVADVEK